MPGMEDRIFADIDALERGAHDCPPHGRYSNTVHYAYNDRDQAYSHAETSRAYLLMDDDIDQRSIRLNSFGEGFNPSGRSRYPLEDALDNDRYDLEPEHTYAPPRESQQDYHPRGRGLPSHNFSRFAFDSYESRSSPHIRAPSALPFSPAFTMSQRHPPTLAAQSPPPRARISRSDTENLSSHRSHRFETPRALQAENDLMQLGTCATQSHDNPSRNESVHASKSASRARHGGQPVVQGITLVSSRQLPDSFKSIFPFPFFNAVQSKCFDTIFNTNDNFVLSAPTGGGKTAVLELAICRLINKFASGTYKIVYQAPTKSLCSERQRDWQSKFGPLDLQVAELTGDTEQAQLRNVQHATIIITTPEKWDSMTRKWKDHQKLMQMVKLFLMDEVHILKEDRGATLEAVVSRMKSIGSDVRFVALSATIPNLHDIAAWLGKSPTQPEVPAPRERLGEEFRPVKLAKYVCGYQGNPNDFAFEKTLNAKLPDVITKWSQRKPIMVFCFIRSSCVDTAKFLASWWASKQPQERHWSGPRKQIAVENKDLRDIISSGVTFHHAGLSTNDRAAVEAAYLHGDISVICCTSTLAVGINLPCHMVIIKNTVVYQGGNVTGGCSEYSDLEVMQMLGRAGRPQFDSSAVAVIMTRLARVSYYEKMITGQEMIESCLHRNLIDHLNAEIGLGTITNASSAIKWLSGTFLFVRLKDNPEHYRLEDGTGSKSLEERLDSICKRGISGLEEHDLVQSRPKLHCTEFGNAMARYCVQFATMKSLLALPPKSKVSEILSAIAQAAEFKDVVRFRAGEKPIYKELNKNGSIKFPIPVNLDSPAHKVSLIIQSVLGAVEFPGGDPKARQEYTTAKAIIFQHAPRFVRCIIDCQLHLDDAVSVRNALLLARSFGAQVWDDSPLHMKQLTGVGLVSIRKLAVSGIKSIEDIENTEAHLLEAAVSRNPPFGAELQAQARLFPKLRLSLNIARDPVIKKGDAVMVSVKAEIGFLNEKAPEMFNKKPVYVCFLAETSDGAKVHFARISAKKLKEGQDIFFNANLESATQMVRAYVMCDDLAGTARHAILKHNIPSDCFPVQKQKDDPKRSIQRPLHRSKTASTDEFGDADINDTDLADAENEGFVDIDEVEATEGKVAGTQAPAELSRLTRVTARGNERQPRQLPNGKWACNHACKNKNACKHSCCRDGLDKKPKQPRPKEQKGSDVGPKQTQLNVPVTKGILEQSIPKNSVESQGVHRLNQLHKATTPKLPSLSKRPLANKDDSGPSKRAKQKCHTPQATVIEDGAFPDITLGNHQSNGLEEDEMLFDEDDDYGDDMTPFSSDFGAQQKRHTEEPRFNGPFVEQSTDSIEQPCFVNPTPKKDSEQPDELSTLGSVEERDGVEDWFRKEFGTEQFSLG